MQFNPMQPGKGNSITMLSNAEQLHKNNNEIVLKWCQKYFLEVPRATTDS